MRWRAIAVTIVVIVACLIALNLASDVLVDWLWFSAVGYRDVFWTIFGAKAVLFIAVFLASAVCLWVSGTLAFRFARRRGPWLPAVPDRGSATVPTLHDTLPELFGVASPRLSWRLLIAARRRRLRATDCRGRDRQLGPGPPVHPSGAVRPERSPLRQGHRLLSLLASRLRRAQELDAGDTRLQRASRQARCTGHMATSRSTPASVCGCHPQPSPTAPSCWASSSR